MKNFSFWDEYEGASEGSGRSEKIWLINPDTGQTGLFKFKKDENTTDHISECIACKLADVLELACARFEPGTYQDKEGSMSYNIIRNEEMVLIEGLSVLNLYYPEYNPEKFMDESTGMKYSLEMIENALSPFNLFKDFLNIPVFDYLIGNTDRHHSNWALVKENHNIQISPLYDNSSSLCSYIPEKRWAEYLGRDQVLWKSLVDTKSKSLIRIHGNDKTLPTHLEMLNKLKEAYYEETYQLAEKIISIMTKAQIYDILGEYDDYLLPEMKKRIIANFLLSKVEMLKQIYWGKEE